MAPWFLDYWEYFSFLLYSTCSSSSSTDIIRLPYVTSSQSCFGRCWSVWGELAPAARDPRCHGGDLAKPCVWLNPKCWDPCKKTYIFSFWSGADIDKDNGLCLCSGVEVRMYVAHRGQCHGPADYSPAFLSHSQLRNTHLCPSTLKASPWRFWYLSGRRVAHLLMSPAWLSGLQATVIHWPGSVAYL